MKKIIHGKTYNTNSARLIGRAGNISLLGRRNFNAWEAGLYITPRGRYFLAGEGGAKTDFSYGLDDGSRCWGGKIIPLTDDEAMEWAEEHLPTNIVEQWFGHEEDGND